MLVSRQNCPNGVDQKVPDSITFRKMIGRENLNLVSTEGPLSGLRVPKPKQEQADGLFELPEIARTADQGSGVISR